MATTIIDKAKSALGKDTRSLKLVSRPVHDTGYGLMGLTWGKNLSQEQAFASMRQALESGANFWNGGEIYGKPERNSLHLLNEYFTKYPADAEKVVISIKGGFLKGKMAPDGSSENTRRSIEECINVLAGTKKLDIWESARVDPNTPIEVTMREADKFVKEGKLGGVGLSECSADTIRRAAKVTKISAVEVEFSLWETTILKNGVTKACAELGIPIVAYSPLGRGFLTGQIKSPDDIPEGDLRRHHPRFHAENFYQNLELVHELEKIAQKKGATSGQIGIAWVRAQSRKPDMPTIIPIPGASSPERVKENFVEIELSDNDVKEIDALLETVQVAGERYPPAMASLLFGNTPELKE